MVAICISVLLITQVRTRREDMEQLIVKGTLKKKTLTALYHPTQEALLAVWLSWALSQNELTFQSLLFTFNCLLILFKFSFCEMTEGVGRSWWGMIVIFKLHGLAKKSTDLLPRALLISIYLFIYIYIYTQFHTHT